VQHGFFDISLSPEDIFQTVLQPLLPAGIAKRMGILVANKRLDNIK